MKTMLAARPLTVTLLCLACLLLLAVPARAKPMAVTVSIPPQKYFVQQIGGAETTVTVMADKGRDPHSYEPTAAQMEAMGKADIYIAIGVPFETQWLPKFTSLNPSLQVVSLLDGITRLHGSPDLALRGGRDAGHNHHHGLETDDPHVWLSPQVMAGTIPVIVEAFSKARPEKAADFSRRGGALAEKIIRLDTDIAALFAALPPEKRLFLTFHQGWAYYAHNYGLREVSVELEGREPSPRDMARLMDFAAEKGVTVIVASPITNTSVVTAITRDIKGEAVLVNPLDENWPDMLRGFSQALAKALAKTVP